MDCWRVFDELLRMQVDLLLQINNRSVLFLELSLEVLQLGKKHAIRPVVRHHLIGAGFDLKLLRSQLLDKILTLDEFLV